MNSEKNRIKIPCLEVRQPIGSFYVGVMGFRELLRLSYADRREIEESGSDRYLGIQRRLSLDRVADIKKYVRLIDATFPSSIILAVSSTHADYDASSKLMAIDDEQKVAKIIDGQHRIAGLEGYEGSHFDLSVTIFVDMEIEDQAFVFATMNLTQTKVNRSLTYDLYEYERADSPQKTCHNIARFIHSEEGSPFASRIKLLGTAVSGSETLTQAAFVECLMPYISDDPMSDRDTLKRGKKLSLVTGAEANRLIFRNFFVQKQDAVIARVLWNYFSAVSDKWSTAWKSVIPGNVLNRRTGFAALMRLLGPAYNNCKHDGKGVVSKEEFDNLLSVINLSSDNFTKENYLPGSTGEKQLFKDLLEGSRLSV